MRRAYLGIARELGLGDGRGVGVLQVMPDRPASRAGLRPGDLLASLGGEPTRSVGDVQRYLGRAPTGSRIEATVIRGGRRLSLAVVLAAARD